MEMSSRLDLSAVVENTTFSPGLHVTSPGAYPGRVPGVLEPLLSHLDSS